MKHQSLSFHLFHRSHFTLSYANFKSLYDGLFSCLNLAQNFTLFANNSSVVVDNNNFNDLRKLYTQNEINACFEMIIWTSPRIRPIE